MEFITIKGEFYRYPLLDRVLAVLNYHKNSAGDKLPDMGRDGFAYKSIKLKDDIQNGPLLQHEVVIEVDTMNVVGQSEINLVENKINLMVLISPFKTLDYIVCKIPLVSNSLAGTLITIPINVAGMAISFLPKRSERGILGSMKRTLELPFESSNPVIPGEKGKSISAVNSLFSATTLLPSQYDFL